VLRSTPHLSAQVAIAAAAGLAIGLLDALLVVAGLLGARGAFQFVPARIWIASPIVWLFVAAVVSAGILPFAKRSAGVVVAAVLTIIFVTVRLRAHPAILITLLALFAVIVAVIRTRILRWAETPRRGAVTAVLGTAAAGLIAVAQPIAPTSRAAPAAGSGPNVIVIFLDTVRYDALFDEAGRVRDDLPTLTRVQRESTVFGRAYAPASWTLPSHLAALTGLPVHELGVSFDAQIYRRRDQTLAERFRERGYRTAAVISNSFLNAGTGVARGFDTFEQSQTALDVCRTVPGIVADAHWPWFGAAVCNWTASQVTGRARPLLNDEHGPFFLMLNYMDAHDPYYVERSCGEPDGYRAAVRCLDRHLAPVVDWRSPRRPTVLAVLGDHGEQFGEHGLERHGNSLYVQLLHVPLMIRGATSSIARQNDPVSIAALPALLDDVNASSLDRGPVLGLLHPPAASNLPSEWSAIDRSWHLIVRERGTDALYDVSSAPAETRNVLAERAGDPAVARLRTSIDAMRRMPKPDLGTFRSLGYLH